MPSTQASNIQELLDHADWLRRLATRLVFPDREDAAADAVQQTWLAALRSPRHPSKPARPWLATVVRNVVIKTGRTAGRRRSHETTATTQTPAESPSPEQLLESMELQRLLTGLVEALSDPYRTTVLLRYYEGIEPSEIARRLDVPAGTVRWRLSEGLAQLRKALADKYADRGVEWQRALLPLVLPRAELRLGGTSAAVGVGTKLSLAIGVVAIGLAGTGVLWARRQQVGHASAAAPAITTGVHGALGEPAAPSVEQTSPFPPVASATVPVEGTGRLPSRGRPPAFVTPPPGATASDDADGERETAMPPARVAGVMKKEDLQAAIRLAIPAVKTCYEKYLDDHPGKSHLMVVSMKLINKNGVGHLSQATVKPPANEEPGSDSISPTMELCVLNALIATPFPAPTDGEVHIEYPFQFVPSE